MVTDDERTRFRQRLFPFCYDTARREPTPLAAGNTHSGPASHGAQGWQAGFSIGSSSSARNSAICLRTSWSGTLSNACGPAISVLNSFLSALPLSVVGSSRSQNPLLLADLSGEVGCTTVVTILFQDEKDAHPCVKDPPQEWIARKDGPADEE